MKYHFSLVTVKVIQESHKNQISMHLRAKNIFILAAGFEPRIYTSVR